MSTIEQIKNELWQKCLNLLIEYVNKYKKAPDLYTIYKGCQLGQWLLAQKEKHKAKTLSLERTAILRSIDVDFDWQVMFDLLDEYTETHDSVPIRSTIYKGEHLGEWLITQQNRYRTGDLPLEYVVKLRAVGVELSADFSDERWDSNFELLSEYVEKYDSFPSPQTHYKGVDLGAWLSEQVKRYNEGELPFERESMLRSVGMDFTTNSFDECWRRTYDLLSEYVKKNGSLPKPKTLYKGVDLGAWLGEQIRRHNNGELPFDSAEKLRKIGVNLKMNRFNIRWERKFVLLSKYIMENDYFPDRSTIYKGEYIGQWLGHQLQAYKQGKLSPYREEKLRSIGVDFTNQCRTLRSRTPADLLDRNWRGGYKLLKDYIIENKKLPEQSTFYKGFCLGSWLNVQKRQYQNGLLSKTYEQLLRSVGVDFESDDELNSVEAGRDS